MNEDNNKTKEARKHVVSTRLTDREYAEVLLKISDDSGVLLLKVSDYVYSACTGATVHVYDAEIERYKAFIAARTGNNINQIARRLNHDNVAGKISEKTYEDVLLQLRQVNDALSTVLRPLEG